ncbi:MAG: polysaccharide biosynthesis tyrosine autokinase [Pseudomonadota bacterium]
MNTDPFISGRAAPFGPRAAPQRPQVHDQNGIEVGQIFNTLWRGRWIMLLCMIASLCLAIAWLNTLAVNRYTASTVIALQSRDEQVVDFDNVLSGLGGDGHTIKTEIEVMRARGLFRKLVADLDLTQDPEFNRHIRDQSSPVTQAVLATAETVRWILGRSRPDVPPSQRKILDDTVETLLDNVAVANIRDSYVFNISVTTRDPAKSALIADRLAALYIRDQVDAKFQATDRAISWLADQVKTLEGELEASENAVKLFTAKANLVSEEALALRRGQLKEFRTRRADLMASQTALGTKTERMRAAAQSGDLSAMAIAADDEALQAMLVRTRTGGAAARQAFSNQFQNLQAQISLSLRRAQEQAKALQASIAEIERQVNTQSAELLELQQLQRVAKANQLIYEYFLGRLKEITVQRGIQQADSRVLSPAVVPEDPSAPQGVALLMGAILLGGLVGAGLVLLRELANRSFRAGDDLERLAGITVLGEIAKAPVTKRHKVLRYMLSKPSSELMEGLRNLRTSITLSSIDTPPKVILLSSSVPGEGKTTLSIGLAHSFAPTAKRVLLIEGDIRRRTFGEYFETDQKEGFATALKTPDKIANIVVHDEDLGIDVLLAEPVSANAADVFAGSAFRDFLDKIRDRYDVIIIDTPPVLAVPDARMIGALADMVLYVVRWDETSKRQVSQGLHAFASANVSVNGLVLSQVDRGRQKAYGYGDGVAKGYYTS